LKIDLPLAIDLGYWYTVPAELVDVAPHLEATFAVYRAVMSPYKGLWAVAQVETGAIAAAPKPTKALAVSWARKYLATKPQADLDKAVRELIKVEPLVSEMECRHTAFPDSAKEKT
jgi:hypothetical protein